MPTGNNHFRSVDKKRAGIPTWDQSHHLSPSRNNHNSSNYHKEFFDKRRGRSQHASPLVYVYRTAFDGQRPKNLYENHTKYYWERRMPVHPQTLECDAK